jgi:hypothetical protein
MQRLQRICQALTTTILLICLFSLSFLSRGAAACSATDTSRGAVTNTFSVPSAGQYKVWSRIMVPDTTSNSYTLNIDSTTCGVVIGDSSGITPNKWVWVDYSAANPSSKVQVNLTAGTHTATLIGREDSVKIDRVVFTGDLSCIPTGTGDNCASPAAPPTPVSVPYRLDAGGAGYTDSQGQVWNADKYFTMDNSYGSTGGVGTGGWNPGDGSQCQTATINSNCTTQVIGNTTNQKMYQTERWGDFHYDIPVPNGSYTVKLKFAEINPSHGVRTFNVTMNGNQVLSNFSIAGESGNYVANDKTFPVTVTGGNLNLTFSTLSTTTNSAEITGIEILPAPVAPAISSVAPASASASGGTRVTLTGTNFVNGAAVSLGGVVAANVVVASSTSISATVPAHAAGVVDVVVKNPNGQTATKTNGFIYLSDQAVTDLQSSLTTVRGLIGSYFNNANLSGTPNFQRLDNQVNLNWGSNGPPGFNKDNFSVRWVGTLTPPANGTYSICTNSDDGVRLWINGSLLVDSWVGQPVTRHCADVPLTTDAHYPIKYEYFEGTGNASVQLLWSGPGLSGTSIINNNYLHVY